MPEIIEESGGGFVYETEAELMSALDQLLRAPSLRHKLGLRGYQAYQQKWRVEAHLRRYFALIGEIAATQRARTELTLLQNNR